MAGSITKSEIDDAVRERNVAYLSYLIRSGENLSPEARDHLADVILGLLTGKIKFPRHRPKNNGLYWEKRAIGERVWLAKKSKGLKKISSAVHEVAKDLRCSTTTVWKCWKEFDPVRYELKQEERAYDAMVDAAYEARWETAVERLTEEHGAAREFSDEEVEAAAEKLDAEWSDYDY